MCRAVFKPPATAHSQQLSRPAFGSRTKLAPLYPNPGYSTEPLKVSHSAARTGSTKHKTLSGAHYTMSVNQINLQRIRMA